MAIKKRGRGGEEEIEEGGRRERRGGTKERKEGGKRKRIRNRKGEMRK